jgi:hypothetical protein
VRFCIAVGNTAVLSGMVPVLNERVYKNGASAVLAALQMAVCASNEVPEDREELGAPRRRLSQANHPARPFGVLAGGP